MKFFRDPYSLNNLAVLFSWKRKRTKKEPGKIKRIGGYLALVTHLLVEFIDRRGGKVKGRSVAAGLSWWCSTFRHFVFGHFLPSFRNWHLPLTESTRLNVVRPKIINRRARSQHKSAGQRRYRWINLIFMRLSPRESLNALSQVWSPGRNRGATQEECQETWSPTDPTTG